jgi:hypothetical protein
MGIMRLIISMSIFLFIAFTDAYSFPVYISFNGYKGEYFIDKYPHGIRLHRMVQT